MLAWIGNRYNGVAGGKVAALRLSHKAAGRSTDQRTLRAAICDTRAVVGIAKQSASVKISLHPPACLQTVKKGVH